MPLNEIEIQECVSRYKREFDRYSKITDIVYKKAIELVEKKLTVRATVQRRTKGIQSFSDKLKKNANKYSSIEEVFSKIGDLAAVRIATYLESDRESVVAEIIREFRGPNSGEPVVEFKDKDQKGKHYRASHCQVYLTELDTSGDNENLKDTSCEIQVCSLLAHVFNEIEHELQNKPHTGNLSKAEGELLDQLGLLTKAGDITIARLLAFTDQRLKDRKGFFDDVYDFVARMRDEFPDSTSFSVNASPLYDELILLNIKSPEDISKLLKQGETLNSAAKIELDKLISYIQNENAEQEILEPFSSDILLCLLLRENYQKIISNHPAGYGIGRPSRLGTIARKYRDMIQSSSQLKV